MLQSQNTTRLPRLLFGVALLILLLGSTPGFSQCLDYTNSPDNPVTAQVNLLPDGYINDIAVVGDIAWAARTFYGALVAIDISDPDQPVVLGTEPVTVMDETFFVVANESHAYVSYVQWGGDSAVRVFDISDPLNPLDVGNFTTADLGLVLGMDIRGDWLYVSSKSYSGTGLAIADISSPGAPALVSEIALPSAQRVNVVGDFALICNENWPPYVVNISDPLNPVWVAYLNTANGSKDLAIAGNFAYVATGSSLDIVAIDDPANSELTGSIDLPDFVYHVSVVGNLAYVSCRDNGVQIVDVSQPSEPVLVDVIDLPGFPYCSYPVGDRILTVVSDDAMYVAPVQCPLDVTAVGEVPASMTLSLETTPNPFNPRTVLSFDLPADTVVTLEIFDVAGRSVRTLLRGEMLVKNQYQQVWNGRDNNGREVGSGVFYALLRAGDARKTLPLTLLR